MQNALSRMKPLMISNTYCLNHHDYHTTRHLQLIPHQLCYCFADAKAFAKHYPTTTQFIFRALDGSVIHTGSLHETCKWIASRSQPFLVQNNILHNPRHQSINGFRFIYTPNSDTMHKRVMTIPTQNPSVGYSTKEDALTTYTTHTRSVYHHTLQFVEANRKRLPLHGHIDILTVDNRAYYITDITDQEESSLSDADDIPNESSQTVFGMCGKITSANTLCGKL